MSVIAKGYVWVMEQVGEKQDFESELTRLGFQHEHFELQVDRPETVGAKRSLSDYVVRVTNAVTGQHRAYMGGANKNWVARCAADLARGAFGTPTLRRPAYSGFWRLGI